MFYLLILCRCISDTLKNLVSLLQDDTIAVKTLDIISNTKMEHLIFVIDNTQQLKKRNVIMYLYDDKVAIKIIDSSETTKKIKKCTISQNVYNFENFTESMAGDFATFFKIQVSSQIDFEDYDLFIDVCPKNNEFSKLDKIQKIEILIIRSICLSKHIMIRPINMFIKLYYNDKLWFVNFYKQYINSKTFVYLMDPKSDFINNLLCQRNGADCVDSLQDINQQEDIFILNIIKEMRNDFEVCKLNFDILFNSEIKFNIKNYPVISYSVYINIIYSLQQITKRNDLKKLKNILNINLEDILEYNYLKFNITKYKLKDAFEVLKDMNSKMLLLRNAYFIDLDDVSRYLIGQISRELEDKYNFCLFYAFSHGKKTRKKLRNDFYNTIMQIFISLRAKINLCFYILNEKHNAASYEYFSEAISRLELRSYSLSNLKRDFDILKDAQASFLCKDTERYLYSEEILNFLALYSDFE